MSNKLEAALGPDIHLAIIQPDERYRMRLGRWLNKDPEIKGWKVFVSNAGDTLRLEALR